MLERGSSSSLVLTFASNQCNQAIQLTSIPPTQSAMARVDSQPRDRSQPRIVNWPMMLERAVMSIITVMTGIATTPLITALQYNAFTGSREVNVMPMQVTVARVSV